MLRDTIQPAGQLSNKMKWEYQKIDLNTLRRNETELDVLNAAGAEGWELVAVDMCNMAILKRGVPAAKAARASSPSTTARAR